MKNTVHHHPKKHDATSDDEDRFLLHVPERSVASTDLLDRHGFLLSAEISG
jgi:hypothetical protein